MQHIISPSALLLIVVNVLILLLLAVLGKNILSYALCFGVVIASQSTNIATRIADESEGQLIDNLLNFEEKRFLFTTCICFLNARGLSCCLDNLTIKQKKKLGSGRSKFYEKLLNMTAYLLYLPGLFLGPVYLFNDFEKALNRSDDQKTDTSPATTLRSFVKILIFSIKVFCFEYSLHSLYSTAASQNTAIVASYDVWQYSGFVVSTCFLHILKMSCIYGSFKVWESLDDMEDLSAQLPIYNETVHLASQAWRYTNPNMYRWLREYISKPIVNTVPNKYGLITAGILSFCSLSLLHSTNSLSLSIWLLISILCSTIETWSIVIGFAFDWESKIKANLSASFYTALMAYICLPLFALSLVSNLFYVTENFELALDLKMRLTDGLNLSYLTFIFAFLYSGTYSIIEATKCITLYKTSIHKQKRI